MDGKLMNQSQKTPPKTSNSPLKKSDWKGFVKRTPVLILILIGVMLSIRFVITFIFHWIFG